MPRSLMEKVSPATSALVVIDMQNDFCHEGPAASKGFDAGHVQSIVPNLQQLITRAREVGTPVVFARVSLTDETVAENFLERSNGRPYPCKEGTWGAEWYGVSPEPGEVVISKPRFSMFIGTDFRRILQEMGVQSLILTGTRTNVCVECTARDGYQNDFYIVVLSDCTAASDQDTHIDALNRLEKGFGVVATSDEVIEIWEQLKVPVVGA